MLATTVSELVQVCWRSAKVQLNSGILERRSQNWDQAMEHFRLAAEADPTNCEPDYHMGVTMITGGKRWVACNNPVPGLQLVCAS